MALQPRFQSVGFVLTSKSAARAYVTLLIIASCFVAVGPATGLRTDPAASADDRTGADERTGGAAERTVLLLPLAARHLSSAERPKASPVIPSPTASSAPPLPTAVVMTPTAVAATPPPPDADQLGVYGVISGYAILNLTGATASGPTRRYQHVSSVTGFSYPLPVAGDWDGDGLDTLGVYDSIAGRFVLAARNAADAPVALIPVGGRNSLPVAGDWDGDGRDSVGVYDFGSGSFRLLHSPSPQPPGSDRLDITLRIDGAPRGWPMAGDWDGDGVDTPGVYVTSTGTIYLRNRNTDGPAQITFNSGRVASYPVVGDFDGDGMDSAALYDVRLRVLAIRDGLDAAAPERLVAVDSPAGSWVPVAGRWDARGPTGEHAPFDWPSAAPEAMGFDRAKLEAAYTAADGIAELHSLLVIRHGKLVGERYYDGFDAWTGNNVKSVSKSVLSALVGIAVAEGRLAGPQQLASTLLPEQFSDPREPRLRAITLGHLLTMTAGFDWSDDAQFEGLLASGDWSRFVTSRPMVADPGARFAYNTGLTMLGAVIVERAVGQSAWDYAQPRLFEPLGIRPSRWDVDPQGHHVGGSEMWFRPRDMARFGELYLHGGALGGRSIVDPAWVTATTRTSVALDPPYGYGGWWWQRSFAGYDTFFAWGYGGQFIFVVPDLDMVVVATSAWWWGRDKATDQAVFELLETKILPALAAP